MSLTLRRDVEERLRMLAESHGVSLDAILEYVVTEKGSTVPRPRLSAEEWAHQFEEWADSVPGAPLIPDEALSRESLYSDRS